MKTVITIETINQAISGLSYGNPQALKCRLVEAIRSFCAERGSVGSLQEIDADHLIKHLWEVGDDPVLIKKKRKNLSSVKSAVNKDLKDAYKDGRNPRGLIVGRDNVFVMSDEAKDKLLSSLGGGKDEPAESLKHIAESLENIERALANAPHRVSLQDTVGEQTLAALHRAIDGLTEKLEWDRSATPPRTFPSQSLEGGKDEAEDSEVPETMAENENGGVGTDGDDSIEEALELSEELEDNDEDAIIEVLDPPPAEREELSGLDPDKSGGFDLGTGTDGEIPVGQTGAEPADQAVEAMSPGQADPEEVTDMPPEVDALDVLEESDEDEEDELVEVDDLDEPQSAGLLGINGEEGGFPDQIPGLQEGDSEGGSEGELHAREAEPPGHTEGEIDTGIGQDEAGQAETETEDFAAAIDPADEILEEEVVSEDEAEPEIELSDDDVWETPDDDLQASEPYQSVPFTTGDENDYPIPDSETQTNDFEGATVLESDIPVEEVEADEDIDHTRGDLDVLTEDIAESPDEVGLPESPFEGDETDDSIDPDQKTRLLAEAFDGYLGAMERYYNQYLLIPEGNYAHGDPLHEAWQTPASTIALAAFYMGKFPVTNALFEVFVERTGYVTLAEEQGHSTVYHGRLFREKDKATGRIKYRSTATIRSLTVPGACWYRPTGPGSTLHQKRNHPVVHVALDDALAFAAWTGKRLPTEAEWEAAARTQRGLVFPWGNEWKGGTCNIEDEAIGDTTPVNAFKAGENELGIADALGNVLEWTSDISPGTTESLPAERHQILKGGSWTSQPGVRLTNRFKMDPQFTSNIVGFRCAVD